jgi:hypothetical protein
LSDAAYSQENESRKARIAFLIGNLSMPKKTTAPSLIVSYIFLYNFIFRATLSFSIL